MDKHESQIIRDEHNADLNAKKVTLVSSATINAIVNTGAVSDSTSYYQQSSLASGYVWHGFTAPGSNPTTASFRIQREELNRGLLLFASGVATFTNTWSSASLSSISYS